MTNEEREGITPNEDEAPDSGFEEEREEWVREHPDDAESGGGEQSPPGEGQEGSDSKGSDPSSALEQDIGELSEKARERDEYLALAQRTQADFENYRKRVAKDLGAAESRGVARLAKELLPTIDNLDRALDAEQLDPEGLRLIRSEFHAALARQGIESYSPRGEAFDPNLHEAMAKQPVEGAASGTVAEVYQEGYRIDGAVLRPARVVVAE
jgi:molecular chaperone GrpE